MSENSHVITNGVLILKIGSELTTHDGIVEFKDYIGTHQLMEDSKITAWVLDYGDVKYINSTGTGFVIGLMNRCREKQMPFAFCGLNDQLVKIFEMFNLHKVIEIYKDAEAALQDLGNK